MIEIKTYLSVDELRDEIVGIFGTLDNEVLNATIDFVAELVNEWSASTKTLWSLTQVRDLLRFELNIEKVVDFKNNYYNDKAKDNSIEAICDYAGICSYIITGDTIIYIEG